MKKRIFTIIMALLAVLLFAGCGGGSGSGNDAGSNDGQTGGTSAQTDTLSGGVSDILADVLKDADAELPPTFDDAVTADTAEGMLGLTSAQFEQYVTEATVATAAINTSAYEVALIKCTDKDAASEVKALVASGFNSEKWICVMPERSFTVESGTYVLLVVGQVSAGDAILASFTDLAEGNVGNLNIFYAAP